MLSASAYPDRYLTCVTSSASCQSLDVLHGLDGGPSDQIALGVPLLGTHKAAKGESRLESGHLTTTLLAGKHTNANSDEFRISGL